jgi:hypothetical protein
VPSTALEARIAATRLARGVARDYRHGYGVALRVDASAIEFIQRHLRTLLVDEAAADAGANWEMVRHGALLSEIFARTLGGEWVDVASSDLFRWAMLVPPAARTYPFERVHRFVTLGHTERDIVGDYLELVERSRTDATR